VHRKVNFPSLDKWAEAQERASPEYAAERARLLFGCYPRGQVNDPETYVTAVAAILCEFPVQAVQHATDPRTGVARRLKFLPSVAEVSEACERSVLSVWASLYKSAGEQADSTSRRLNAVAPRAVTRSEDATNERTG
jgi:hypothetical protein